MNKESVGIVETQYYDINEPITLDSGKTLEKVTVAYETYGELNKEKTNAILICHALTGDAHAAGWHEGDRKPGWWEIVIGPGKALDTEKFFIICSNVLGGCKGTTGPSSINPETGKQYGLDFPVITIRDMVKVQKKLVDSFGISQLYAIIGGSMGGMQVLDWMVTYPAMMKKAVPIATTGLSSPQQIAFNEVGRQAIFSDPNWNNGNYYETGKIPENGLSLARMIAHITYLSDESMDIKFGRDLQDKEEISYDFSIDFQVESYLKHQGETFVKRFDANSYLFITKAVDLFDLSVNDSLIDGLKEVECKTEVISVDSDWLYPTEQSTELVTALNVNNVEVSFSEIKSNYGHDAFLLERGQLNHILSKFLSSSTVEDLMMENIATIKADADVQDAAKLMLDKHVTHIPVVTDENKLIGIVTSWDLSKSIATNSNQLIDIMTTTVKYCHADDTIEEIARQMRKFDISCLPVVDEDMAVLGLITTDQISNLLG
ncbi:MAG: homoserine O-acetyltransferase [Methanobrevibacter sp.]|uniref:homoserine O-acetyltransferase MetX n=1 Tax=Methanobrevibacter sp. TaxID=66852 RepID=UPI00257FC04D|nr:homoserine O-acetyltransferase [Methanobrevibacter sp.]MBR2665951.1 homoserine O-acetyltransferase [Methanobrevibacter sp.]MBR3197628.1 homoserine O-acetyltransferase [Methanobrevibacter sp.]MBR6928460.1 homoserine O-acetyltransferase [Methanobrevibacter sp.]MBR7051069.1 homoserine O-acetyltransferase [Methanobrevibacter sp.]